MKSSIEDTEYIKKRKEFIIKFPALSKKREDIYKRDNYKCFYCGLDVIDTRKFFDLIEERQQEEFNKVSKDLITFDEFESFDARKEVEKSDLYKSKMATLDHKIPLSDINGTNDTDNLVTCCKSCNSRKSVNIQLENGYTRIANDLLEKFSKVQMSGTCWQVLMAILRKLYGFNKKEDWIEYSQIMKITNLPKSRISHSVKQLREYGIVTQTRNGIKQVLGINKKFDIVSQKRNSSLNVTHTPINRYAKVERTVPQTRTTKETFKEKRKDTKETPESKNQSTEIPELVKAFEAVNPACSKFYGNPVQRRACEDLIKSYGFDRVLTVIKETLPKTNGLQYFPTITTPLQLNDKWASLESAILRHQSKKLENKTKVAFC